MDQLQQIVQILDSLKGDLIEMSEHMQELDERISYTEYLMRIGYYHDQQERLISEPKPRTSDLRVVIEFQEPQPETR